MTYAIHSKINLHTETHTHIYISNTLNDTTNNSISMQFRSPGEYANNTQSVHLKYLNNVQIVYLWHSNNHVHDHGYYVNK